jgi:uncharacterized protein (TIGR00369 family)
MADTPPPIEFVRAALENVSAAQGFNGWLGCKLERCETGVVELTFPIRPEATQHHGFAHGALVGAAADNACAWAAATVVGDVVTGSFTIQFLAPAKGTRLRARGEVIKAGRRLVSVEARVFAETDDETPKLVAVALAQISPVGG